MGFPIRKSSDQRVFAPPRRLSQRITSFIACACQGIHQMPLRHLIILIANIHPCLHKNLAPVGDTNKTTKPSAIDEFDKKDQLLEINPMALRLSGQSSAWGLMSAPCDIFQRSRPKAKQISTRKHQPLNIRKIRTYLLFTISYRTSNRRT